METKETRDRILEASARLFTSRGYKKTTTKLIAQEAGVNEVTIFRLFGKKKAIVEEIITEKLTHIDPMALYFKDQVTYDLSEDLYQSSVLYFRAQSKNFPFILTLLDELGPDFVHTFSKLPARIVATYKAYFDQMVDKGLLKETDTDFLAKTFVTLISGLVVNKVMTGDQIIDMSGEDFIKKYTKIFVSGIA